MLAIRCSGSELVPARIDHRVYQARNGQYTAHDGARGGHEVCEGLASLSVYH